MVRKVLGVLLILLGIFPVLMNNGFSFSQLSPTELVLIAVCLVGALLLIFWKKKSSSQPDGVHSMTFELNEITHSPALIEGQRLYLRPYMGADHDKIAITNEKAEAFGFVPQEYQAYVLERIESHSLTHTVIEKVGEEHFGAYSITVKITC